VNSQSRAHTTAKQTTRLVGGRVLSCATSWRKLEFFLVRYIPNALRDEFINIALVMVGGGVAEVRFVRDWQRVLALDPDADIGLLKGLMGELRDGLRTGSQQDEILLMMETSFSNAIQLSPRQGCLTDDLTTEIETMTARYL
jgi:hypothetical protein